MHTWYSEYLEYSEYKIFLLYQEGPATHLCLIFTLCRSYEKKSDFAGPSREIRKTRYLAIFKKDWNCHLPDVPVLLVAILYRGKQ